MLSDIIGITVNTEKSKPGGISMVICRNCSQTYIHDILESIPDCPKCVKTKEEMINDSETE
jgi:hypothetical protein